MSEKTIRISEIFGPTIQGEGALIGQPTIFVRTGGCDYRCTWCDSLHAVDSKFRHNWKPMSAEDVFSRIDNLSGGAGLMVSLSGGNPAIHDFKPLIDMGHKKNYRFALETQGSITQDWFADLDVLTLSPKPPSSGEKTNWGNFDKCLEAAGGNPEIALKIVIMNSEDYEFARDTYDKYPHLPLYLQPANHTPPAGDDMDAKIDMDGINSRMRWLVDKVMQDKWYGVTILPQLHIMLWGNLRGV